MSYQAPINEPSTITVRPQRIRNDNAQSLGGLSGGMKDILITGAALGIGAVGGYYLLDYLFKNDIIDKIMGQITPNGNGSGIEPAEDDADANLAQANIAHTIPYDRTTRVNSYGNTGVSAYRGRAVAPRLSTTDEYEINSDFEDPGFNQVFTDHEVIEVI